MSSRLSQREYIAVLAVVSVAVLALGVWLKPKELPKPTVSGEETQRLQTLTQRRNLENVASYFSEVAESIQPSVVWLDQLGMTGLVWNQDRTIVTAGPDHAVPRQVKALTAGGEISVAPQVASVDFQASLLKAPQGAVLQPVFRGNPNAIAAGSSILQLTRQAGGGYLFTPGDYGGMVTAKCGDQQYHTVQSNIPLSAASLGGGLFDVDGNLLGVVLRCNGGFAAVTPEDVDHEIARATSFEGQLLRDYGLRVVPLDDISKKYFQAEEGLMVKDVADGQLADTAGLLPGDVITALNKNLVRVTEDLRPLSMPPEAISFEVEVRRDRRVVRIALRPDYRAASASALIGLTDLSQGYLIDAVAGGSRADRAAIQSGDRLLMVDGKRPGTLAALRSALSDGNSIPMFVVLQRGKRKIGTFLN